MAAAPARWLPGGCHSYHARCERYVSLGDVSECLRDVTKRDIARSQGNTSPPPSPLDGARLPPPPPSAPPLALAPCERIPVDAFRRHYPPRPPSPLELGPPFPPFPPLSFPPLSCRPLLCFLTTGAWPLRAGPSRCSRTWRPSRWEGCCRRGGGEGGGRQQAHWG